MASLNRASLIGNVVRDPEIRNAGSSRVANLTVATSETWKDKSTGEKKEKSEFHRVTVWNDGLIGVIEKYVHKGDKIMIEGQIQTRKYEKDGHDVYTTEIVLTGFGGQLILLGGKSGGERTEPKPSEPTGGYDADIDDEIPF